MQILRWLLSPFKKAALVLFRFPLCTAVQIPNIGKGKVVFSVLCLSTKPPFSEAYFVFPRLEKLYRIIFRTKLFSLERKEKNSLQERPRSSEMPAGMFDVHQVWCYYE
jgi:hypothetical protein